MSGFLKANDGSVIDEDGAEILLRGVGIGDWLLPEGYMWRLPAPVDRPRRMESLLFDLVGKTEADGFWRRYWDRFVVEEDVAEMAAEGFNSVRLPVNWRYACGLGPEVEGAPTTPHIRPSIALDEERMERIDRFISWCRTHGVYVVLDLHGAPGGQTGANIDDSAHDIPELFTEEANADATVALWRALAQRYADEWIVAGYDLLNEPLPNHFARYNDLVLPLYRRITEAIREVDPRHMIIVEGVHWATDWSIFTEPFDDNVMLQFHKYWNSPDVESVRPYLKKRREWSVPIYMGEGGENNTDWYTGAFRLYEDLGISWNFWTWKKMDTNNSPLSIRRPDGWKAIVDSITGAGPRPASESVAATLASYADNVATELCERRPGVVASLFRRPPVRIPAIFFAFSEHTRLNDAVDGAPRDAHAEGGATARGFRDGDGFEIVGADGAVPTLRFAHGGGEAWAATEWASVRLDAGEALPFDFDASRCGGPVDVAIDLFAWGQSEPARLKLGVDEPSQTVSLGPPVASGETGPERPGGGEIVAAIVAAKPTAPPATGTEVAAPPGTVATLTSRIAVRQGLRRLTVGVASGTAQIAAIRIGPSTDEV